MNTVYSPERIRYLTLLAQQYPTVQSASTEIIRLQAILNLPKGTEHFMSDIHGEHEAFLHILNSSSGEVRAKIDDLFGAALSEQERGELAALIYYPTEKLALAADEMTSPEDWYRTALNRLVELCRHVSTKHTRNKVRSYMPAEYAEILDEMVYLQDSDGTRYTQYESILETIIRIGQAPSVIEAISSVIKALTCDHLHIVGDIFDRGPRADIVMDSLMKCHHVDIQWGNHDLLWMGAASGSRTMVATVLSNSIHYNNLDVIETGYGISLRPLSVFANEVYKHSDTHCFDVKLTGNAAGKYTEKDKLLSARMYKAITIILFKLEGQKLLRCPEFGMNDRLLLQQIDYDRHTVRIDGREYPLEDCDFPTVNPQNPYELTAEESRVIQQLTESFRHSEKLQQHIRFLYTKGSLYKIHNGNLLFHGCIPMREDGSLMSFCIGGEERSGRAFMDYADRLARKAYYDKRGTPERRFGLDFLWWLWAGRNSPIYGRDRMTTFERRLIRDESTWVEAKNPYYAHYNDPAKCAMLLAEFGLTGAHSHIINGHVPVRAGKGESPIKGGGRLLVIDGGFSEAYQPTSGIAGYTLLFNSRHYRMVSHQPFPGRENAIRRNDDIQNDSVIFETLDERMHVAHTDEGRELQLRMDDLLDLLNAYRSGAVTEAHA